MKELSKHDEDFEVEDIFDKFRRLDNVAALNSADILSLFQLVATFGLLPMECAEFAKVFENDAAHNTLRTMYGEDVNCVTKFEEILHVFSGTCRMHVSKAILYKCLVFINDRICRNPDVIDALREGDLNEVRNLFNDYENQIHTNTDLLEMYSYDDHLNCFCHIFYIFHGRLKMRQSTSSNSIYIEFKYGDDHSTESAHVVGTRKNRETKLSNIEMDEMFDPLHKC